MLRTEEERAARKGRRGKGGEDRRRAEQPGIYRDPCHGRQSQQVKRWFTMHHVPVRWVEHEVLVFNLYLLLHVPVLNYEHMMLLILDRKYDALEREVVKVP